MAQADFTRMLSFWPSQESNFLCFCDFLQPLGQSQKTSFWVVCTNPALRDLKLESLKAKQGFTLV